jgi:antirestriction protein ArdC
MEGGQNMNDKIEAMRMDLANEILRRIESKGAMKWIKEWWAQDAPYNAVSKRQYKGINTLYLSLNEYEDPRWLTFHQAEEQGWHVKKGAKSSRVEYWQFHGKEDEETGAVKTTGVLSRYFNVFNAEQIEGIPALETAPVRETTSNPHAEAIAANCGVKIIHGGAQACYSPDLDNIHMPHQHSFFSDAAYYSTLLHEIAHSTGHPSRLDRSMCGRFGDPAYAIEELNAELAASFVSKEIGVYPSSEDLANHLDNHAAYIKSWQSRISKDRKVFLNAVSTANKIASYMRSFETKARNAA